MPYETAKKYIVQDQFDAAKHHWNDHLRLDDQKKMFTEVFIESLQQSERTARILDSWHSNQKLQIKAITKPTTNLKQKCFSPLVNITHFSFLESVYSEEFGNHVMEIISRYVLTPFSQNDHFSLQTTDGIWTTNVILADVYNLLPMMVEDLSKIPSSDNILQKIIGTAAELVTHPELASEVYQSVVDTLENCVKWRIKTERWESFGKDFQISIINQCLEAFKKVLLQQVVDDVLLNSASMLLVIIEELLSFGLNRLEQPRIFQSLADSIETTLEESENAISLAPSFFPKMTEFLSKLPGSYHDIGTVEKNLELLIKYCQCADKRLVTVNTAERKHFPIFGAEQRKKLLETSLNLASNINTIGHSLQILLWYFRTANFGSEMNDANTQLVLPILVPWVQSTAPPDKVPPERWVYLKKLAIRGIFAFLNDSSNDDQMLEYWWPEQSPETKKQMLNYLYKSLASCLDNPEFMLEVLNNWKCDFWSQRGGSWDLETVTYLTPKLILAFKRVAYGGGVFKVPKNNRWDGLYRYYMKRLKEADANRFQVLALQHVTEMADLMITLYRGMPVKSTVVSLKQIALKPALEKVGLVGLCEALPDMVPFVKEQIKKSQEVQLRLSNILLSSMHMLMDLLADLDKVELNQPFLDKLVDMCSVMPDTGIPTSLISMLGCVVRFAKKDEDLMLVLKGTEDFVQKALEDNPEAVLEGLFETMLDYWKPCFSEYPFAKKIMQALHNPIKSKEKELIQFLPLLLDYCNTNNEMEEMRKLWIETLPLVIEPCVPYSGHMEMENLGLYLALFVDLFQHNEETFRRTLLSMKSSMVVNEDKIGQLFLVMETQSDLEQIIAVALETIGSSPADSKKRKRDDLEVVE